MKKRHCISLVFVLSIAFNLNTFAADFSKTPETYIVKASTWASTWDNGYGVANGRLGALVYGIFPHQSIVLNENSIFSKADTSYPQTAKESLRDVRKLCIERDYIRADSLFATDVLQQNDNYSQGGSYQSGGVLEVDFVNISPKNGTCIRTLDMLKGIAGTSAKVAGGEIITELVSVPEYECTAYRITTTIPEGITVDFELTHPVLKAEREGCNAFILKGAGSNGGTEFENRLIIISKGGYKFSILDKIRVFKAKEILILSTISTDYNIINPSERLTYNISQNNIKVLKRAERRGWRKLVETTASYFTEKMLRCQIELGHTPDSITALTTPQRIELVKNGGEDNALIEKLFQFGRYCLIANSRQGGLPCGLQGIWNPHLEAPWRGCYFLNINCQMNYWLAELTNLSEHHTPFLDLIIGMHKGGENFAKAIGYDGFCCGHNVDCWRETYFRGGSTIWSASLLNGAWATAHLLEHYRFTRDREYLEKSLPILESNCKFILSWFSPDSTGAYLSGPSSSPETGFIIDRDGKKYNCCVNIGNSHDQLLGREVLLNYIFACNRLGIERDLTQKAVEILPKIALPKIGTDGALLEWREDLTPIEPGHRHFSHCYGVFPGNEFDLLNTPLYANATLKALNKRIAAGSGYTGWSRAWVVNLYAALQQGDSAYYHTNCLIKQFIAPNLFDMHPPFQIDGNLGVTSGIANCLLQSSAIYNGRRVISLLPALPKQWITGKAEGLKTRDGLTVDMQWDNGKLTAYIKAEYDGEFIIMYGGEKTLQTFKKGELKRLTY